MVGYEIDNQTVEDLANKNLRSGGINIIDTHFNSVGPEIFVELLKILIFICGS